MAWPITADDVRAELGTNWVAAKPPAPAPDPLEPWARAAVERIEAEIGQASGQSTTVALTGPTNAVVLTARAGALVSVVAGGVPLDLAGFTLDGPAGIVYGRFPSGPVMVTVTAPTEVPTVVELAARLLAATWVKQSKIGPPNPTTRAAQPDTDVAQGFAMPRRVSEMIRPFRAPWGFS